MLGIAQPYEPIRFSRPSLPSDPPWSDNDARTPCEKGGPGPADPHQLLKLLQMEDAPDLRTGRRLFPLMILSPD
ncbi:MAG: hypothetical protein APF80_07235 [Alphaproteobacteria bacterium BRH_c36]|nr:MAG: hypothetical protein APF80_07235 [Alphaproteobacteria bacterium BRH_c36]